MWLNKALIKVHIHFSDEFSIQNGLKQGNDLEYAVRKVQ
jgi:hypothetical protein